MALSAPIISSQDGVAAAAVNQANGATVFVTPGNSVTFALQSSTGVQQASMNLTGIPGAPGPVGLNSPNLTPPGPFSWTVLMPPSPGTMTLNVESTDGFNPSYATYTIVSSASKPIGVVHRARMVSAANNESLTAFVGVTGGTPRDGVTCVQGDVILLAGQSTKSQNGLYQVGVVAANTAPLTRIPDFATGLTFSSSDKPVCEIAEGTLFQNSVWKVTTTGAITVDTTNHDWFPRQVTQTVTLATGFVTKTNVPILSTTTTAGIFMPTNFSGASTTVSYRNGAYASGGAATVAGIAGTGSISVTALVAAGTFNTNDVGTGSLTIINF
jgi:hypothetical protein